MTLAALPPETKLIQNGVDSFRLILPRRNLGKYRWIGLVPLIFGLGICGFASSWMSGSMHDIFQSHGIGLIFSLVFGLAMLPGLLLGLGLIMLGLAIVKNWIYTEIAVNRTHIKNIEHFGFCRWSWKMPTPTLFAISIGRGMSPDVGGDLGAAHFHQEEGPGLKFGAAYSMTLLRPIAENLVHLVDQSRIAPAFKPKVFNSDTEDIYEMYGLPDEEDTLSADTPDASAPLSPVKSMTREENVMPAGTDITVIPQPNGLAISIPPAGFKGIAKILILIGSIFSLFPCLMLMGIISSSDGNQIPPYLLIGIFLAIGIGALLGGINSARQRFMVAAAEDKLAFRRIGIFGTKEQLVPRSDISAIHIGPSNVTVNDVPVMELQIERRGDVSTIGVLSSRSNEEINWIAGLLRKTLNVGAEPRFDLEDVADEAITQPAKSKITIQRQGAGHAITIPPTGMFRGAAPGLLVFGAIFAGIPTVMAVLVVKDQGPSGILLFLSIFLAIGMAAIAYAIKTGRQRVLIAVTPDMLAYQRTSPFGTSKQSYPRSDIIAIGVGRSGASANNKPFPELKVQVGPWAQGKIGLLQGYSTGELVWLAAVLRSTLKVGKITDI